MRFPTFQNPTSHPAQSVMDSADLQAIAAGADSTGVVTGGLVSPSSPAAMTVDVPSSTISIGGTEYSFTGATATISAAGITDRRDIVYVDLVSTTPTIVVASGAVCGTANWTFTSTGNPPVKPSLPDDAVLLAEVYVAAGATSITSSEILDKRVFVTNITEGPQGDVGPQGNQGFQGPQGNQGFQGVQGVQGAQGNQGFQGVQGYQGTQGNQGAQGVHGGIGPTGAQGFQGSQGFQGASGPQGIRGTTGATGATGSQGFQGFQGANGNQGPQGNQGVQGVQGVQGTQGVQGGGAGPQGNQGSQGPQGFQGTQGAQGAQGSQGNQGVQGAQGTSQLWNSANFLPTGYNYETAPRMANSQTLQRPTGRTTYLTGVYLPIGTVVTKLGVVCTTGSTLQSAGWMGLVNNAGVVLCTSADKGADAYTVNAVNDFNIAFGATGATTSFTTTYSGIHYVAMKLSTNGTTPGIMAINGSTAVAGALAIAPSLGYKITTATTDPIAVGGSLSQPGAGTDFLWYCVIG